MFEIVQTVKNKKLVIFTPLKKIELIIKKRLSASEKYNYIAKNYGYVLDNIQDFETSDKYKDVIWQIWFQGKEQAPELVQKCIDTLRANSNSRQVILITQDNVIDFINIPDYILEKYRKGIISHAHFADYIRACLISKYGGLYIDANAVITAPIPEYFFEQECFFLKSEACFDKVDYEKINVVPLEKNKKFRLAPKKKPFLEISNWLVAGKPNNRLTNAIVTFLNEYWKKENIAVDYFFFHYFVKFCTKNDAECKKIFLEMDSVLNSYSFLMERAARTKEYSDELFNKICKITSIHKFSCTFQNFNTYNKEWLKKIYSLSF